MPLLALLTALVLIGAAPAPVSVAAPVPVAAPATLVVHIEGLRSAAGSIHVGFYKDAATWESERSDFQRHGSKAGTREGRVTFTYTDVPPGHYAAAIVDDENDSGGMDWGLLLPKEGFGFSNYVHRGLLRPNFDDFDFDLRAGATTELTFRVRYL